MAQHGIAEYFSLVYEPEPARCTTDCAETPEVRVPVPARVRVVLPPARVALQVQTKGRAGDWGDGSVTLEPAPISQCVRFIIETDFDFADRGGNREMERHTHWIANATERILKEAPERIHAALAFPDWGPLPAEDLLAGTEYSYSLCTSTGEILKASDVSIRALCWFDEVAPLVCAWLTERYRLLWEARHGQAPAPAPA